MIKYSIIGLFLASLVWAGFCIGFSENTSQKVQPYIIEKVSSNNYTVDLKQEIIDDGADYMNLYLWLLDRDSEDTVTFLLHGYGGSAQNTSLIINGIHETKANVISKVIGQSYSGHAYIACHTKQTIIGNTSFLMYHGVQSSQKDTNLYVAIGEMMRECVVKGYITEQERLNMIKDPKVNYYYWNTKEVK